MTTVNEFLTRMANRKRCDNKPHELFIIKLQTEEVHSLMRTVLSWASDPNPNLSKHGLEGQLFYPSYLNKTVDQIDYCILERLYGGVLLDEQGNPCVYESCCK